MAAYDKIAFWKRKAGEDANDWRNRLLDDGILVGADSIPIESQPGIDALCRFLDDKDQKSRLTALAALTCAGLDWGHEGLEPRVLARLEDPDPDVRVEAIRCCRAHSVTACISILLRLLAEDEGVRAALRDPARPPLAREIVGALEGMDVQESQGPLQALGVRSRYLDRAKQGNEAGGPWIGRYVPSPAGHTPLLPEQDPSENPACPGCGQPSWMLAALNEPYGPAGAGNAAFYRCLSCVTHTPFFVELSPIPRALGPPDVDQDDGTRAPAPDAPQWSVEWKPGKPQDHPYVLVLGGTPVWVQQDETPVCPQCDRRMDFAVQLPGESEQFPVVEFQGVIYGFWCSSCRVTATLFQV